MTSTQAVRFMEKRGATRNPGMFADVYYLGDDRYKGTLSLTIHHRRAAESRRALFDYIKNNGRNLDNKILIQWIPADRFRSARHLEDFLRVLGMPEDVLREG